MTELKCKNCKHWKNDDWPKIISTGMCNKILHDWVESHNCDEIYTDPEFGCICFE